MFEVFTKMFFVKVKSRINGKEFVCATRTVDALVFVVLLFAVAISAFFVNIVPLSLPDLVAEVILLALFFVFIYLAFTLDFEGPKNRCSKVFLQLDMAIDNWEQAGISKELADLMRIKNNLNMQMVKEAGYTGYKRCKFPDSFYFSIRKIVKKIDREIFYQV